MNPISTKRHSLAHLLAATVLEKWPKAKLAIGPDIENGFYGIAPIQAQQGAIGQLLATRMLGDTEDDEESEDKPKKSKKKPISQAEAPKVKQQP